MSMRAAQARGPATNNGAGGTGPPGPPGPPGTPGSASWVKTTITYLELAAASFTNDFGFYSLPGTYVVHGVAIVPTIAFTGPGISSYDISIGVAAALQDLAPFYPVTGAPGDVNFQVSASENMYSLTSATSIRASARATGAFLNVAIAGSADIYLLLTNLNNI